MSAKPRGGRSLTLATDVGVESGLRPGEVTPPDPVPPTREYDGYTIAIDGPVTVGDILPRPDEPPMSDLSEIASKHASKRVARVPVEPSVSLASLIGGPPEPDADLVTLSVRIPRYLAETVSLMARMTRKPQQTIVSNALHRYLPVERVDQVRETLYP